MLIDVHTHIGRSVDGGEQSLDALLAVIRRFHVTQTIVFPIDEKNPGPSYLKPNQKIASAVKHHRHLIGCARLDPNQKEAAFREIARAVQNRFRAVKLHPRSDRFTVPLALPLFSEIEKNRLIVILHTDHEANCHPKEWLSIFKAYRKTFFILTHAGKDRYREAVEVANECPNVYLDTSTLSYYRTSVLLRKVGPEKIVFASDAPYSHLGVEKVKFELLLSKLKQKLVFSDNARKILEL